MTVLALLKAAEYVTAKGFSASPIPSPFNSHFSPVIISQPAQSPASDSTQGRKRATVAPTGRCGVTHIPVERLIMIGTEFSGQTSAILLSCGWNLADITGDSSSTTCFKEDSSTP